MTEESIAEQLRISDVIRGVHEALVEADTRETLERQVCAAFADAEPYVFAWIGSHDVESDEVVPRTSAGVSDSYLDSISISPADDAERKGPTATAIRTGTVQVMQDVRNDPAYAPWREEALEQGFESSAAVPLVDDDVSYGVLNLYADRPEAFGERERVLLAELGETIATACAGIEAREDLEAQKEKYERFTTRISDAYYAVDDEWRITYWNQQMAERTDTPAAEVLGETLWEAFPSLEGTALEDRYRQAMAEGKPTSFEYHVDDPFDYWVEIDVYPDERGLSTFSREITERKEREQALEETNAVLRTIVENLPMGLLVEDTERNVLVANQELCDTLDMPMDCADLVGRDCEEAAQAITDRFADPDGFVTGINTHIQAREVVQSEELPTADGRILERDYVPYELPEGKANLWLYRDISGRKERERELERSRQIIENSTDIATIIDETGTITYVSPAVERVLGFEPSALVGEDGFRYQPSETGESVAAGIERVLAEPDGIETVETRFQRADGSFAWIESTLRNFLDDEIIDGILVSSREITERKAYETRLQEQRDDLQTLNQVLRHDIRNDLQLVIAYAELVAERLDDDSDTSGHVQTLYERARHAAELTETAGNVAEALVTSDLDQQEVSLRHHLLSEIEETRDAYPQATVAIEGEVPGVTVTGNEMLGSVFRNLLKNGILHNDSSAPTVTVGVDVSREDGSVRVRIADDGPGIPDDRKADIFDKGEKGLGSEGTGLGLHLVETLVDAYGGEVMVEDNEPTGVRFVVDLPRPE